MTSRSSNLHGLQIPIAPEEQAQELKKLSNEDMVVLASRIVTSVDDCNSAEYLLCGFDDFYLLPSRRRSKCSFLSCLHIFMMLYYNDFFI